MATAFLMHGYLAAGKSTHSRLLADQTGAVLIGLDEWYLRLYTDGRSTSHQDYELLQRLVSVLDDHWPKLLAAGVDVVLDFGFWKRTDRDRARTLARSVGAAHRLIWVRTDDATALRRCHARAGSATSFLIDTDAYRDLRARYEPPDPDEAVELVET